MEPVPGTSRNSFPIYSLPCAYCHFSARQHFQLKVHVEQNHLCEGCGKHFKSIANHYCNQVGGASLGPRSVDVDTSVFKEISRAHRGVLIKYTYTVPTQITLVSELVDTIDFALVKLVKQLLKFYKQMKCKLEIYFQLIDEMSKVTKNVNLSANFEAVLHNRAIDYFITSSLEEIIDKLNSFNDGGSCWTVDKVISMSVIAGKYTVLRIGKTPRRQKDIKYRRGVLPLTNSNDDLCFKYAVSAALYYKDFLENRISRKYKDLANHKNYERCFKYLNFSGLHFPIHFHDIEKFEKMNSVSISCFTMQHKKIVPVHLTRTYSETHVDLFIIDTENKFVKHILPIVDFSKFLNKGKYYFCPSCLSKFSNRKRMLEHHKTCITFGSQIVTFPKKDLIKATLGENTVPSGFIMFYDFECYLKPKQSCENNVNCNPDNESYTIYESEHIPIAYGLCVISNDQFLTYHCYCGTDVLGHFINLIISISDILVSQLKINKPVVLSENQRRMYDNATVCCICNLEFTWDNPKVLHHIHHNSEPFRGSGATHNNCNLNAKVKYQIPLIALNSTNYDMALVLQSLKFFKPENIEIIPKNSQHFLGMIIDKKVRLLDSVNFVPSSLDNLVETLKLDKVDFNILRSGFAGEISNESELELLCQKGILPYEWISDVSKLQETKLPCQSDFFSKLKNKGITNLEYKTALKVWNVFKCKSVKDYLMLYLKTDVLLLAQAMMHFYKNIMKSHHLNPWCYFTGASHSWNAMLHFTLAELEIMKDYSKVLFIDQNIRGGMCHVGTRYIEANNDFVGNYNVNKPRKFIQYADLNSLYAYCLSSYLPINGFEWMSKEELQSIDIENIPEDSGIGYYFEVDLSYSREVAKKTSQFPLCPILRRVHYDELSNIQKGYLKKFRKDIANPLGSKKLLLTVENKTKYGCYYKLLKYYLYLGLVVTKRHRCLKFNEVPFLKPYVDMNIEIRNTALSQAIKKTSKDYVNKIYGKTLQKYRDSSKLTICTSRLKCEQMMSKCNFKDVNILSENVSIIEMRKLKVEMSTTPIVGTICLDLAKLRLFECLYGSIPGSPNYMKGLMPTFQDSLVLAYSDTDSLIYSVQVENEMEYFTKMKELSHMYDFSNLPRDHPLFDPARKGIPGLLKIESDNILSVCALRPKSYALLKRVKSEDGHYIEENEFRCAGTPSSSLQNIKHDHFKKILEDEEILRLEVNTIQLENHSIFSKSRMKIAMSCLDTKRYQIDAYNSLPFGHYDIPKSM